MGIHEEEAPRLSEIGRVLQGLDRKIDDFRGEVRMQLSDKVSKEVYMAERNALVERDNSLMNHINTLDAKVMERVVALEAKGRSQTNTIYGGLASIIVGVVLFYIQNKG